MISIRSNLSDVTKNRWEGSSKDEKIYECNTGLKSRETHRRTMEKLKESWMWYGNVRYCEGIRYCEKFNVEFKERVRAYWGYKCVECGSPQNGRKLHIHHVHYDKKMCCNGSPHDVVPLCQSCHMRTNGNREYWEDRFTELIYQNNTNGKCFFTREEMKSFQLTKKTI